MGEVRVPAQALWRAQTQRAVENFPISGTPIEPALIHAIAQVKAFDKAINVSGLVITKLDGSAKGGVLAAIACQCPKPVRYIGVGEQVEDLQPFSARAFAEALLG